MGKHVVVGSGQVGTQLGRLLVEQGHQVVLVSRSGSAQPGVESVAADAADAGRMADVARGAEALYNCANPAYHRWLQDWPPIAASLLHAAESSGASYVILGNLYGYGQPTRPMRETDALTSTMQKARVRVRMWQDALAAHDAGRIRATELRASDYFGPGCKGQSQLGERFVPRLLAGKRAQLIVAGDQPHSWTYVPDVATALATAAADDRSWGRAWHVPTDSPRTAAEMAARVCELAGVPNPGVTAMPRWLVRALGAFMPVLGEIEHVRYQFENPFVLDSSDFQDTFGVKPTPVDEALAATIAWWRSRGGVPNVHDHARLT
jgi:nucleoside-diphosphate-sugar epimerase